MFRSLLIGVCVLGMSACGGGGESALVDACVEQGDSKKDCACMAEKLEDGLSPEAFDAIVLSAQGKEEAAEAAMQKLGMADAMQIGTTMIGVVASCGVSGWD